jgi:uncharacterized protein
MLGPPLSSHFDLIYGTSTGSIIAALLALGKSVDDIHELYETHVVAAMGRTLPWTKTWALRKLAKTVFKDPKFDAFKTNVGIVATRWTFETPLIFKTSAQQAFTDEANFVPGFGCRSPMPCKSSGLPMVWQKPDCQPNGLTRFHPKYGGRAQALL